MSALRRAGWVLGGLCCAYGLLLVILGFALEGQVEERVKERLAHALRADEVEIGDIDLSLVRGRLRIRDVRAERNGIGTASLDIASLDLRFAKMGWALVDDDPESVLVRGAHLRLSAVGAATLRASESAPLEIDRFTIEDSSLHIVATSLFPSLGKAELAVRKAQARDLELSDAMSWLYKTDLLDASLHTTGDLEFAVAYGGGALSVSGSFLGSTPITVPFSWPIPDPSDLELSQILDLASSIARTLAPEIAKRKAQGLWEEVIP